MKNTKRVTFTLMKSDIRFINNQSEMMKMYKSNFVSLCIENCFPLMEEELDEKRELGYDSPYKVRKKFFDTHPITVTLPIEVVEKLNYYSKEIGIKKSHLVSISIYLMEEKIKKELSNQINDLMDSITFTKEVVED
ncbi:hypothetical protein [Aliarcobacter cryaerophilus]|uniref:hypothetical protein n=1 Tax=Aliarcobacter cryaerophilus TaxID=28198 RepID=UPI0021B1F43B|nr:hypothetical protein [Aliarcobacter cryaerophilus]MCT7483316.1 hypothetical protein [Aliarcobacter cryaerophilus]